MNEVWKPIVGFENKYEVSNFGRIRSLDKPRVTVNQYGALCHQIVRGRIKKTRLNNSGYERVPLSDGKKNKEYFVHRLVAEAFLVRRSGCNVVNHKDFNRLNNCVSNLEWVTHQENTLYSYKHGRFDWSMDAKQKQSGCKVNGHNIENGYILELPSMRSANKIGFIYQDVDRCCRQIVKQHKGYIFWKADITEN